LRSYSRKGSFFSVWVEEKTYDMRADLPAGNGVHCDHVDGWKGCGDDGGECDGAIAVRRGRIEAADSSEVKSQNPA
jgi:hypothetical protein